MTQLSEQAEPEAVLPPGTEKPADYENETPLGDDETTLPKKGRAVDQILAAAAQTTLQLAAASKRSFELVEPGDTLDGSTERPLITVPTTTPLTQTGSHNGPLITITGADVNDIEDPPLSMPMSLFIERRLFSKDGHFRPEFLGPMQRDHERRITTSLTLVENIADLPDFSERLSEEVQRGFAAAVALLETLPKEPKDVNLNFKIALNVNGIVEINGILTFLALVKNPNLASGIVDYFNNNGSKFAEFHENSIIRHQASLVVRINHVLQQLLPSIYEKTGKESCLSHDAMAKKLIADILNAKSDDIDNLKRPTEWGEEKYKELDVLVTKALESLITKHDSHPAESVQATSDTSRSLTPDNTPRNAIARGRNIVTVRNIVFASICAAVGAGAAFGFLNHRRRSISETVQPYSPGIAPSPQVVPLATTGMPSINSKTEISSETSVAPSDSVRTPPIVSPVVSAPSSSSLSPIPPQKTDPVSVKIIPPTNITPPKTAASTPAPEPTVTHHPHRLFGSEN